MRIQPYLKEDGTGSIKVYPCKTAQGNIDLFRSIDVYIDIDFRTQVKKAEVNWSGCGASDPTLAKYYGEGIKQAAWIANYINEHVTPQKVYSLDWLKGFGILTQAEHAAYWAEKSAVTK